VRLFGTFRDITLEKQLAQDAQTAYAMLAHANRRLQQQQEALVTANEKLQTLASLDGLTGLNNRRAFEEFLARESELRAQCGRNTNISLVILDVDEFKLYNDTFGHPAGDEVLARIGRALRENARGDDFVARYGGEEFAVVLPNTDVEAATRCAERIRVALEQVDWPQRGITASLGVSTTTSVALFDSGLVWQADEALYVAKRAGRNRVMHYDRTQDAGALA
jgi:diguanylate cyclase (GGDEF)-like protein